jgi:hypothetical protein
MDSLIEDIARWIDQPVKIWHLIVVAVAFGIWLHSMRRQMIAIGKSVWMIIDFLKPPDEWPGVPR